jgi:uncharacterized phage-like protein YoqJ
MIVAITGSRPTKIGGYKLPNPIYNKICREIERLLLEMKPEKCLSGMALGADQYFASVCLKLRIPLVACIPFEGQEMAWPQESQKTFRLLRKLASEEVIVSDGGYAAYKMQIRNEWMVDHCDKLIAVWDGTKGGTGNCIEYAQSVGREIIFIDPRLDI